MTVDISELKQSDRAQVRVAANMPVSFKLSGNYFGCGGLKTSYTFYALADSAGHPLYWELRHILPALGYSETTASGKLSRRVREWTPKWTALLQRLNFQPVHAHLKVSENSFRRSRNYDEAGEGGTLPEWSLSTTGLICIMLHWAATRRAKDDRELVTGILRDMLLQACSADDCDRILQAEPSDHVKALCTDGGVVDGRCSCVRTICGDRTGTPRQAMVMHLLLAASKFDGCRACCGWLHELLLLTTEAIDSGASRWGPYDVARETMHLRGPSGKRRRLDRQFMQAAGSSALVESQAFSAKSFLRSTEPEENSSSVALSCERRSLREHQAAAWLMVGSHAHIVHIAWDACRVGNPSRELLAGILYDARRGQACHLPPAVPCVFC